MLRRMGRVAFLSASAAGFLFGASTNKLYRAEQITQYKTLNPALNCSTHVCKSDHSMRCRPYIVAIEQPVQLLAPAGDHFLLQHPPPLKLLLTLNPPPPHPPP